MAAVSRWRVESRDVIAKVHASLPPNADEETVRKALFLAYPFGERGMLPYKIWLSECKRYRQNRFGPLKAAAAGLSVTQLAVQTEADRMSKKRGLVRLTFAVRAHGAVK